jgi:putative isomerase
MLAENEKLFHVPAVKLNAEGYMNLDLKHVPFSRFGSYLAFSRLEETAYGAGLFLRTVHGEVADRIVFHVEVLGGETPVPFTEVVSPALLRLEANAGYVEICIAEPRLIRVRGQNVILRLSRQATASREGWVFDTAFQTGEGRWSINARAALRQYMLTALEGDLVVEAPWSGLYNEYIRADFVPDESGVFECAIEEYASSWQPRAYDEDFDECARSVEAEYQVWEDRQADLPVYLTETRRVAAYVNWSCVVAPEGRLRRPTMYMSKNWMDNVWSWDHCFNALSLVYGMPGLAWDQFMLMFDTQDEHGALADYVNDVGIVWNFCKPPIHGWTLRRLMQRTNAFTDDHLVQIYDPLCRWTSWWLTYRDSDGDGLPEYNHGNDSGWDNATVFAHGVSVEAPDLAAFLVYQMDVLADMARRLGKAADADRWRCQADELLERMLAAFWHNDHFIARHAHSHEAIEAESLLLYLPILLGPRLPDDVLQHLVGSLKQAGWFLTEHGLATERLGSPYYEPDGYWRGPIWAPSTVLLVDGLHAAGETAFARELSERFCAMVSHSGMAENFNALTGEGLRDRAYSWTSSVFLILGHEYLHESIP